jgi:hypothetical protein
MNFRILATSGGRASASASARRIYAFAENVMENFRLSPWWKHFELDILAMPAERCLRST